MNYNLVVEDWKDGLEINRAIKKKASVSNPPYKKSFCGKRLPKKPAIG